MKRNANFKKRPNPKGKGTNTRSGYSKDKQPDDRSVTKDNAKYNDASWYIKEGQMAKDVASLSFNNALGVPIRLNDEVSGLQARTSYTTTLPGIFTINTAPSFGVTYDSRSPINIAANNIVGFIRSYNSGAKNYDAPDLMLMLGAMDSIYALIAHFMRAYGVARVFSHTNRYIGDALLTAMGFKATEVRQNLANFRAFINMLITKASAICTPSIMSIYRRHFWMYSGVYKDEDIEKSQMYIYRPAVLWSYEENEGAGYLKANLVAATAATYGIGVNTWTLFEWESFADSLINKLVGSQDVAVMSGDILKAYGEGNLWKLSLINEDYAVIPVYSEEVLDQIHNTTFVGRSVTKGITSASTAPAFNLAGFDVEQTSVNNVPYLISQPQFLNCSSGSYTRICDLDAEDPDPERILVATRNMAMTQLFYTSDSKAVSNLSTCGSDLCLYAVLYAFGDDGTLQAYPLYANDTPNLTAPYYNLWRFKRVPLIYRMSASDGSGSLVGVDGPIDNYTTISFDDLRRMHESALLAMLGVPFYGLQTR